jgi:DNA-directed RNA polymerase subunit N (RpoN/RPB10)
MELPSALVGSDPHITVSMSSAFEDKWKPLRCSICGNVVCEYNNSYIRSITPSGAPQLDRAGKVMQCSGVLLLHGQVEPFEILYKLIDEVFSAPSLQDVQSLVAELARNQEKSRIKCKAKYYLS